jgi:hypothetical protein
LSFRGESIDAVVHWGLPTLAALILGVSVFRRRVLPGRRTCHWLFALSRPAYAILLYVLLDRQSGGDFRVWLEDHALPVLEGRSPATASWYGPLLPFLQGGALGITPGWHPIGVLIPFLAGDLLLYLLGPAIARRLKGAEAADWVRAFLLLLPLVWHLTVVHAQDESLFAGLLAAGILLVGTDRVIAGFLVLALGFVSTKLTFAPYAAAAALAVLAPRPRVLAGLAAAAALVAGAYALQALRGGDPFGFFGSTAFTNRGVGLPALVEAVVPLPGSLWFCALGVTLLGALAWGRAALDRAGPLARATLLAALAHQVLMLLMPYRIASYEVQGVFLMLLVLWPVRQFCPGRALLLLFLTTAWLTPVSRAPEPLGAPYTAILYVAMNALVLLLVVREVRQVAASSSPGPTILPESSITT